MLFPQTLSNPTPIYSIYIPPDGDTITSVTDICLGGIGIQNPSQGLQVQDWTLTIVPNGINGDFYISAPNTAPTYLFSRISATWGRLAFDQNMSPFISYVDTNGAGYYWFNPTILAFQFVTMSSDVTTPCCTMDDKRDIATRVGSNDIILAYVRNDSLFYRQQRDQYATEYLLYANIAPILANATLWKVGMNEGMRLQFLLHGNIY